MLEVTDTQITGWIATLLWPLCRVAALFAIAPILSQRAIPTRVMIAFAALIALAIAPGLPPMPPGTLDPYAALPLALQQFAVGASIGFAVRIVFAAIELAGDLTGLQMGFSFAGFIDPQNNAQSPLIGSFLGTIAMLTFVTLDGHAHMIATVARSFEIVPVGPLDASLFSPQRVAAWGTELFASGLQLALPMIGALLVCNAALGVLARAAPQLNLMSVGMPATLLIGFIVLVIAMPHFGGAFEQMFARGLAMGLAR